MRPVRVLVLACAVLAAIPLCAAQQSSVFRAETTTVPVYTTVIGADGHLVTSLTRGDFQVLDNGRPQPLTLFDSGLQPISIIVMLDTSGSMTGNLSVLRSAAAQMFSRLLPADQARVGNFGDRIVISPTFTNDVDALIRTLWLDLDPGGSTPLWGAVSAAMSALARVEGRRVVLVLSDGKDTGVNGRMTGPSLKDVTLRAQTEDFMVYAIGMRSRGGGLSSPSGRQGGGLGGGGFGPTRRVGGVRSGRESDEPDPGLRELADESGGGYLDLDGTDALGPAFARVADELHQQYLLGYVAPEADGKLHQIGVRLRDPILHARARHTYVAPRTASAR